MAVNPIAIMFSNPIWQALTTDHASIAEGNGLARRYPADVLPFCAVERTDEEALLALRELVTPGEPSYLCTNGTTPATVPGLTISQPLGVPQMMWPDDRSRVALSSENTQPIEALNAAHAAEMVALTDVAFPGLFRARTYALGNYFGIRSKGELIAMAGERFSLGGYREISAVCTHPEHTGRGHAARLIHHLLADQATRDLRSFLHVAANNTRAIALYERLGFVRMTEIFMHKITRS
jgi:ribosomal protein S18 acetylase RimI-like enzyme